MKLLYHVYSALKKLQEVRMGVEYSSLYRFWSCVIQAIVTTTSYHRQARIVFYITCVVYIQLHSICYWSISAELRLCFFQQVNNNCSQGLTKLISLHNANYVKQEWKSLLEYKPVIRKLLDWFIANESAVKCFRGVQLGEKAYLIHHLPDMSFSKVNPVTMPIDVINY